MKYYCKIVYKDKIEPTEYFKDKDIEEMKKTVFEIVEKFLSNETISGIYLGKKDKIN